MKQLTKLFLVTTLIAPAMAYSASKHTLVKGSYRWTHIREKSWSELEQLGARKSAENDAVQNCIEEGLQDCVAVSSTIDVVNGWEINTSAVARGIEVSNKK